MRGVREELLLAGERLLKPAEHGIEARGQRLQFHHHPALLHPLAQVLLGYLADLGREGLQCPQGPARHEEDAYAADYEDEREYREHGVPERAQEIMGVLERVGGLEREHAEREVVRLAYDAHGAYVGHGHGLEVPF